MNWDSGFWEGEDGEDSCDAQQPLVQMRSISPLYPLTGLQRFP